METSTAINHGIASQRYFMKRIAIDLNHIKYSSYVISCHAPDWRNQVGICSFAQTKRHDGSRAKQQQQHTRVCYLNLVVKCHATQFRIRFPYFHFSDGTVCFSQLKGCHSLTSFLWRFVDPVTLWVIHESHGVWPRLMSSHQQLWNAGCAVGKVLSLCAQQHERKAASQPLQRQVVFLSLQTPC